MRLLGQKTAHEKARETARARTGFTFVEMMIVISVVSLLMTVAIPGVVRVKIHSNESTAQATLKAIAQALEGYAGDNGSYPVDPTLLVNATPPYITKDYFLGIYNGFTYTHLITTWTYSVTATPISANTGSQSFTITTGGVITPGGSGSGTGDSGDSGGIGGSGIE